MEQLISDVQSLVDEEYGRASEKFGEFHNSDHEAHSVIGEELEEVSEELNRVTDAFSAFWRLVRSKDATDEQKMSALAVIKHAAVYAACECIQVSAMALKAQKTIEERQK